MGTGERGNPPHMIQVVEIRIPLEAFRRLALWESLSAKIISDSLPFFSMKSEYAVMSNMFPGWH